MDSENNCKKTSFITEQHALFYIEKLQKTSYRYKIPQRAYLCPYCNHWHLTSQEDKNTKYLQNKIDKLIKEVERKESYIKHLVSRIERLESKEEKQQEIINKLKVLDSLGEDSRKDQLIENQRNKIKELTLVIQSLSNDIRDKCLNIPQKNLHKKYKSVK